MSGCMAKIRYSSDPETGTASIPESSARLCAPAEKDKKNDRSQQEERERARERGSERARERESEGARERGTERARE